MSKTAISKTILEKMLDDFHIDEDMPNKEYLENYLVYLEGLVLSYRKQGECPDIQAHGRAKARDFEQNCIGLINGIKFGISFIEYKDVDLSKIAANDEIK